MTSTTPRRAAIIHGYGATPADHWFGWLAARLGADGLTTTVPALPDPEQPDPARWLAVAGQAVGVPGQRDVVVAHSLGCLTVLRHLLGLPGTWRLGTLVLVAGFAEPIADFPSLDAFIGGRTDVRPVAARVDRVVVLRSDADPIVPTGHTDRLAAQLGVTARTVPGAGHFLADEGVTTLPEADDAIAR